MTPTLLPGILVLALSVPGGAPMDSDPGTFVLRFGPDGPAWTSVDDRVMGGVSLSRMEAGPGGTGVFRGELSRERGGGFASVRTRVPRTDLSSHRGLRARVRGDGRTYQLRLRSDGRFDGIAHRQDFRPPADEWVEIEFPFDDFVPTFRGRTLAGVEPLDRARIEQVGLMVTEGEAGEFRLELEWIRAYGSEERR